MASALLTCQDLKKSYGVQQLFKDISFVIGKEDKIGLIGPNGAGKSTFLKILLGLEEASGGEVSRRKQLKVAYVPQDVDFPSDLDTESIVLSNITSSNLEEYEKITRAQIALSRVGFEDTTQKAGSLSGGWKKRLSIACALAQEPELLMLDEPTNHLDLESILWLENLLKSEKFAFLVITHDRQFLENVTNSVVELNKLYPNGIFRAKGNYSRFLEIRDEFVQTQQKYQEILQNKVKREVSWLQRGPKARTTKSKSRIQEAHKLINELQEVKQRQAGGKTNIDFSSSQRRTKELAVLENLDFRYGDNQVLKNLNLKLRKGMRLGIVGPNGSGKTTLLRLLSKQLEPSGGTIQFADQLKVVHFVQTRDKPDPKLTLRQALAPDGNFVVFQDQQIHVNGWARRFLFRDEQLDTKLGLLSGGEQARVQIAQLMLRPADILLLDEPTNDLDLPTLEVLENSLLDFPGTLVFITHDRYVLDRISQVIIGINTDGTTELYADYMQWEEARKEQIKESKRKQKEASKTYSRSRSRQEKEPKSSLTHAEKKEYSQMEKKILKAEEKVSASEKQVANPEIASDMGKLEEAYKVLQEAQKHTEKLYARWEELESKANKG